MALLFFQVQGKLESNVLAGLTSSLHFCCPADLVLCTQWCPIGEENVSSPQHDNFAKKLSGLRGISAVPDSSQNQLDLIGRPSTAQPSLSLPCRTSCRWHWSFVPSGIVSQSRINCRHGSLACTFISCFVAKALLNVRVDVVSGSAALLLLLFSALLQSRWLQA